MQDQATVQRVKNTQQAQQRCWDRGKRGGWDVGDMIITPIDAIAVEKRTNASWAACRGAHKISKKTSQSTKGNTSGLIHRHSYADVAAAPA